MPNPWHNSPKKPGRTGNANQPWFPTTIRGWLSLPKRAWSALFKSGPIDAGGDDDGEIEIDHDCEYHLGEKTKVLEVWFAGCHAGASSLGFSSSPTPG